MERGTVKSSLAIILISLILFVYYNLVANAPFVIASGKNDIEDNNHETEISKETFAQSHQEITTTKEQNENTSSLIQRLDRIASILEDRLSSIENRLSSMDTRIFELNTDIADISLYLNKIHSTVAHVDEHWFSVLISWFEIICRSLNNISSSI